MHPAVFEAAILAVLGLSGVSVGLLLGVRRWIPLAVVALAGAALIRTWTSFAVWSIGRPDWLFESWFFASLAVVSSAALSCWRHWKQALLAALSFGGGSVLALATKYVLDIGERHHSDTSNVLGLAVVAIQGEISELTPLADSFKRGISYPLMLGLGPDGRILGGFTPLVYLALLGTAVWVAWTLVGDRVSRRAFVFSTAGVAVFSVSVPMFRAAMFYLNGHTLMAYALILLVGGVAIASHQKALTRLPAALVLLGGTLGVTSRIEGIVLVGLVLLLLLSQRWWSGSIERIRLALTVALIGLTLSWWLISLESPVLEEFGLAGGLLLAVSVGGGALAASSWINPFRRWLYPGAALAVFAYLAQIIWQSGDPVALILTQWPNLGLGQGGWGTAALVFGGSVVLLGWRDRPHIYRTLIGLIAVIIAGILFSKTFDGGFGRPGFYDSVNRMWLHVMPVVILATLVGYSDLLQKAMSRNSHKLAGAGSATLSSEKPARQ